jgi:hypothetical protein
MACIRPGGVFRFAGVGNEVAVGTVANANFHMARSCCLCRNGNYMGADDRKPCVGKGLERYICRVCSVSRFFKNPGGYMRFSKLNRTTRYAIGFATGLVMFIAAPEGIRWLHGSAFAQQTFAPNTYFGTVLPPGRTDFSATGGPGQAGPVIGGSSSVTACPGQMAPGSSVVGTYVPPGSSMTATATGNGGTGPVIGFQSRVTVGGAGCP